MFNSWCRYTCHEVDRVLIGLPRHPVTTRIGSSTTDSYEAEGVLSFKRAVGDVLVAHFKMCLHSLCMGVSRLVQTSHEPIMDVPQA